MLHSSHIERLKLAEWLVTMQYCVQSLVKHDLFYMINTFSLCEDFPFSDPSGVVKQYPGPRMMDIIFDWHRYNDYFLGWVWLLKIKHELVFPVFWS